jgi:hypothetical protein
MDPLRVSSTSVLYLCINQSKLNPIGHPRTKDVRCRELDRQRPMEGV